jgi:hypothetical protein
MKGDDELRAELAAAMDNGLRVTISGLKTARHSAQLMRKTIDANLRGDQRIMDLLAVHRHRLFQAAQNMHAAAMALVDALEGQEPSGGGSSGGGAGGAGGDGGCHD